MLADAIIRLLNDSDLRFRLASEGRNRVVEKFDWEVIAEKYRILYNKLIC
jgi:glycosyltransferase involved in cell wall biosynthesis